MEHVPRDQFEYINAQNLDKIMPISTTEESADRDSSAAIKVDPKGELKGELKAERVSKWVQHPLQDEWMFWSNKVKRETSWESLLVKIHICRTVEEFWSLFSTIKHPGDLDTGCELSFFKHKIAPKWEDPLNEKGGRWVFDISIDTIDRQTAATCDHDPYLKLLLFIIGDNLGENTELVNGIVCGVRSRRIRMSIWLSVCDDRAQIIGETLWKMLGQPGEWYFEVHLCIYRHSKMRNGAIRIIGSL